MESYIKRNAGQLNRGMLVDEVKRLEGVKEVLLVALEEALTDLEYYQCNHANDTRDNYVLDKSIVGLQQAINKAKGVE